MSSITKPSQKLSAAGLVAGAPDAKPKRESSSNREARKQITLTVPADILRRLDALARETGQTRAGPLMLGASRVPRDGL